LLERVAGTHADAHHACWRLRGRLTSPGIPWIHSARKRVLRCSAVNVKIRVLGPKILHNKKVGQTGMSVPRKPFLDKIRAA